jgi:xanthine dehydrogenase accessory factor
MDADKKTDRIHDNVYEKIKERDPSKTCILATVVNGEQQGEKILWTDGEICFQTGKAEVLKAQQERLLASESSRLFKTEGQEIFCEAIGSPRSLVICGAGHVSIPVILLGKRIGFSVTVIEDRPSFADQARRAGADHVICDNFIDALNTVEGSQDTYFVIVTRGHRYDMDCLRLILKKKSAYVGMMGSRKRVFLVKKQLSEEGFAEADLDRLHAPIGLDIAAETPDEIAVSILAEIIQEKNRKKHSAGYDREFFKYLTGEPELRSVLCTIVSKRGSAPREAGTKMLILEDGRILGTIGGGCAESAIIHKGLSMLRSKIPYALERVDMTAGEAEDEGMVCGGTIQLFL